MSTNMKPQPFPLNQFGTLASGQPIAVLTGTLTKLFDRKTGKNEHGEWSIQNAELTQDGTALPVQFKEMEEIPKSYRNREILLEAKQGKQLTGLYCIDDDRGGTVTRKIKVTGTATLSLVEGGPSQAVNDFKKRVDNEWGPENNPSRGQTTVHQQQSAPDLQEPAPRSQTAAQPPPKKTPDEKRAAEDAEFHEARRTVNRLANLHLLCALAVERYEAPAFKNLTGVDMSESQRQGATASIFIAAERSGLARQMPVANATQDPRFQPHE